MVLNYAMDIITKNIDVKVNLPVTTEEIEKEFVKLGIKPLRYAIVNVTDNILKINVTFDNL